MFDLKTAMIAFGFGAMASIAFAQEPISADAIDFGDDSGMWANDGECDDPRFDGPGVAEALMDDDLFRDASDCRAAVESGTATLVDVLEATRPPIRVDGIQFGGDLSDWANDGECDDPRFSGEGMASDPLDDADAYADRSDCLALWQAGSLAYNSEWRAAPNPSAAEIDAVEFGADTSDWAMDGECDDPRFTGPGAADELVEDDRLADATDCRFLFMMGEVTLK